MGRSNPAVKFESTMRWRIPSTRNAADFPPQGESFLRRMAGFGARALGFRAVELAAPAGLFFAIAGPAGIHLPHARLVPSGPPDSPSGAGATPHSRVPPAAHSGPENQEIPQQSPPDGVDEDMATLVLDNTALGSAGAPQSGLGSGVRSPAVSALDPASDAAIMLRVAAGDEDSFNYLVRKYNRAMIHFLFRMVRNQAIAEELAQEVFLRVYRSRESYRAEAKFTTWLYRIATNLAVNHARDTKHERSAQTLYLDQPDEESGTTPDLADAEPSAEQQLLQKERMAAIKTHVMALPERQRMAVVMHKYQGMDYREIGDVLKLSESATKSLLFRAYQTLREKLKEFV
jgi:RNA polymerase sigma-70 factor (ECF subfamily)